MRVMMMIKGIRNRAPRPARNSWPRWAGTATNSNRPACSWTWRGCSQAPRGGGSSSPGGNRTVIDGPFAESKQLIAGDWILQMRAMGGGRGMGVSAFGGGSAARSPTSMAPGICAAR
jgi:hypothetical protein